MKLKKILASLMMGATIALTSMTAAAGPINIGGVVFDPDDIWNFQATSDSMFETSISGIGQVASGHGVVSKMNQGTGFCPTCQLTFTFGGFKLDQIIPTFPFVNTMNLVFTGGWMTFWVQDTAAAGYTAFNPLVAGNSGDGDEWLTLTAHSQTLNGNTGTLFGSLTGVLGSGNNEAGAGSGLFDVSGGLAAGNFDTNTIPVASGGGPADFNFSSSYQPTPSGVVAKGALPLFGTAEIKGSAIPEPASILLLALGLLGVAMNSKRKQA
jgi:hypothetical protein